MRARTPKNSRRDLLEAGGKILRTYRHVSAKTLQQVAEELGKAVSTVQSWEKGRVMSSDDLTEYLQLVCGRRGTMWRRARIEVLMAWGYLDRTDFLIIHEDSLAA